MISYSEQGPLHGLTHLVVINSTWRKTFQPALRLICTRHWWSRPELNRGAVIFQ